MRPIPAPRLGDAHGLLRAIQQRERVRLDEFVTEFSVEELFPPTLENALGRTRQFISFARAAGLVNEDRGTVELTDMGKRYVRAGDAEKPFEISPGQAEWLRRLLRERHMTDSIYHGAAIGLSLFASNPPGFQPSRLDFGRAVSYLGRAGWDNENTFQSQGERYATFLRDLELLDAENLLTATGRQTREELTLPIHMSLRDLCGQLNPGGIEAAEREGRAEREAAAPPEPEPAPPAAAEPSAPVEAAAARPPPRRATTMTTTRTSARAPARRRPPRRARSRPPAAPPVPPAGLWESAAPEDRTKAYGAIRPDAPAPAASSGSAAASAAPPGARRRPRARRPPRGAAGRAAGRRTAAREPAAPRARRGPRRRRLRPGRAAAGLAAPPPRPAAPGARRRLRSGSSRPTRRPRASPRRAPADPVLRAAADAATRTTSTVPKPPARDGFVSSGAIRAAAEEMGLRLPAGVYAGLAAALAGGRHVVIVGPPGAGKTTLALAVAKAGAQAGKTNGASLVTAGRRWTGHDTLGHAAGDDWEAGSVVSAARRNRWLIIDELDRAALDRALGDLSSFLGGVPVALPDGETVAPDDWRVVATAAGAAARLVRPRPALRAHRRRGAARRRARDRDRRRGGRRRHSRGGRPPPAPRPPAPADRPGPVPRRRPLRRRAPGRGRRRRGHARPRGPRLPHRSGAG